MAHLTYRQLRDLLNELSDEQLDSDVTVCDLDDEFHAVQGFVLAEDTLCDVLDPGHPFLLTD